MSECILSKMKERTWGSYQMNNTTDVKKLAIVVMIAGRTADAS